MTQDLQPASLEAENRRLKARIQKLEERYASSLNSVSEIYFEADLAGRLTFCNHRLCEITGLPHSELIGKTAQSIATPDTGMVVETAFREVLETGRPSGTHAIRIITKNGTTVPIETSTSLIRTSDGKPSGFRGIARDISARLAAEEEKQIFTEQMQQAQKLEAIGTLAGGIAHDFNNLLMGIQGNISLILLQTTPDSTSYTRLKKIEQQIRQGAQLTQQLLGFSRETEASPRPCDLNRVVADANLIFSRSRKDIRVETRFATDLKPVVADTQQMEQALLNIYVNAATHAMPDGGTLFITTENVHLTDPYVRPHNLPAGDYIRLTIRDTGVGMDEKTRKRVFDPFFTTQEKGRGTGLGLASVFSIVKHHKGIVTAKSSPGNGTTMMIHLPAQPDTASADGKGTSSLRILLVDDEEMIRDVASDLLMELGHMVLSAHNGKEALAIYDQRGEGLDLVILDMIMPDMSGEEVFAALKARRPDLRILISSGYAESELTRLPTGQNVAGFIQKPFSLQRLAQAVDAAMKTQA